MFKGLYRFNEKRKFFNKYIQKLSCLLNTTYTFLEKFFFFQASVVYFLALPLIKYIYMSLII